MRLRSTSQISTPSLTLDRPCVWGGGGGRGGNNHIILSERRLYGWLSSTCDTEQCVHVHVFAVFTRLRVVYNVLSEERMIRCDVTSTDVLQVQGCAHTGQWWLVNHL